MASFFLSYRRDDSAGFAGRLADGLEAAFGTGSVFRDVDDLKAGERFDAAITRALETATALLVMVGPRWLEAGADGRRRLDAPDDFVRREVELGLASGRPVIPVLVGGATLPAEKDLPASVAGLVRYQAVVLSDADWRMDVERLVARLRELSAGGGAGTNQRRKLVVGVLVFFAVAAAWHLWPAPAADVAGRWRAQVTYDWGDRHDEVFEFKSIDGALHGTATFLGGPLAIEQAQVKARSLTFVTRSQESMSSAPEPRELIHRYIGEVLPDGIHFTLERSGGYGVHPPLQFVARRDDSAAR